jgi:hypothetical protein
LRFFALGGVLGGASATVAFFFPRGIAGKQKLDLEVAVPILEDAAWLRSEANQKLVVVLFNCSAPVWRFDGRATLRHSMRRTRQSSHPTEFHGPP